MVYARPSAEILCEQYLEAHDYQWDHEPDLGIGKAPDYAVRRDGVEFVCEVKEFTTQAVRELGEAAGGPVVVPPKLLYGTIRAQVDAAARQLRPLADRGIPLVVILANPARATVFLHPPTLFHAMYGGGHWALPGQTLPSIDCWPIPSSAGRDGALTAKHAYISAVAVLRTPGWSADGSEPAHVTEASGIPHVETVEALSKVAADLPASVFDGALDARWSPDAQRRYRQTMGVKRPYGIPEPAYAEGFIWPGYP